MSYIIMTDSDSDMPFALKEEYGIPVVHMPYTLEGKEYYDDLGQSLDYKTYYDKMRAGAAPATSALNESNYLDYFEPILKEGTDILFLAFSSQLSSTIQAIYAAARTLKETYPERTIRVVDTLSISAPQTLLVLRACDMQRAGADMETVARWVEENYTHSQAYFVVDDLKYLKRGGRISPAVAAIGTMLDLKPVLIETRDGHLNSYSNVRGRKKALSFIVDKAVEQVTDPGALSILLHADVPEEAQKLCDTLKAKIPGLNVRIENIGPVIGAHAGPGTLAFCFIGAERPQ